MTISRQKKRKIMELILLKKTHRVIARFLKVSNTTIQNCIKELEIGYNKYPNTKDTIKISYISEMLFSEKNQEKRFGKYSDITLNCIKELEKIRIKLL